jgi:hypothetical protein
MPVVNRDLLQKNKTEFSTDLFLFRYGKQHKNTGLVYFDSVFAFTGNPDKDGKRQGILNHSGTGKDTFD